MISNLLSIMKRPVLWQRSELPFWDDEHISRGMLEAHLNPEGDAASRKTREIESSVEWFCSVIPEGARLLDLGCGPGLYTKRLSARGYDVTGMDFSKRSIAYATEQDKETCYIYGDYLKLDYENEFDAVTLIYCDYAALTEPERKVLLSKVYRALKPNGLFIFDVFSERHFKKKTEGTSWSANERGGFWSEKPYICMDAAYLYDNGVSAERHIVVTEEGANDYIVWDTAFTPERLCGELSSAGFTVKSRYDDVCGAAFTGEAETLCFIATNGAK